ncbi:MAG: cupin domain-containing protein, partial [Chloroflexota bacterium]|nr:cupin domain-containing protein [Chloroflexota bacterium]
MPRPSVLASVVAVVLLGLLVAAGAPARAAQYSPEGTPPVEEEFAPEGVTFEPLGFGTAEELPAAPADLTLIRVTFEPGAGFPIEAGDPSVALGYVRSGVLTVRVEAPVRVTRAAAIAAFATPGAVEEGAIPESEEVAAGTEFVLEAGDSYVFPPNVAGEVRNDGQERVVLLVALVAPPEG